MAETIILPPVGGRLSNPLPPNTLRQTLLSGVYRASVQLGVAATRYGRRSYVDSPTRSPGSFRPRSQGVPQ